MPSRLAVRLQPQHYPGAAGAVMICGSSGGPAGAFLTAILGGRTTPGNAMFVMSAWHHMGHHIPADVARPPCKCSAVRCPTVRHSDRSDQSVRPVCPTSLSDQSGQVLSVRPVCPTSLDRSSLSDQSVRPVWTGPVVRPSGQRFFFVRSVFFSGVAAAAGHAMLCQR